MSDEVREDGGDEIREGGAPSAQADTANAEVDTTGTEAGAATAEVDTTGAEADTANAEVDTTGAEADTTTAEVDTTGAEADTANAEVDTTGAEADTTTAEVDTTGGAADAEAGTSRPAGSRRPVVALGAASAVLVLLAGVLGVGWMRASDDLAERKQAHAAAVAEQNRLRAELDAVVARRGQLESDLAAAQAQALDPQSRATIEKCVREYAEYERLLREIVASGVLPPGGSSSVQWVTVTPGGGPGSISVSTSCTDAAAHLGP